MGAVRVCCHESKKIAMWRWGDHHLNLCFFVFLRMNRKNPVFIYLKQGSLTVCMNNHIDNVIILIFKTFNNNIFTITMITIIRNV